MGRLREIVNWLLVADTFFVLASFGWFVLALLGRSLEIPLGFDLWLRLWNPLFMPAIGLLMAAALINGGISYVQNRWHLRSVGTDLRPRD
ncbi:hypothetical protein L5470_07855 [Synechococcus sp. PCC 6717]|jgi:hypothetical protein|uniref:Uncharacterized protein n=1 Tax=Parathermosynechococcus lividus PCC 6715 TaxID=1917166 RepID=A0A2D2Q2A4_PARLV|nr:hypothetical protein [Thermostichus lividus]ATS18633.1 hypothetical protein BRW62_07560 [Thermostichus lividus PCC 6715]MCH9056694.1 hypothetical protein [Synechococcus sp. PCC 6716]MCI3280892.1 hypothetical protein [Synechococcus sp. PCC 6717]